MAEVWHAIQHSRADAASGLVRSPPPASALRITLKRKLPLESAGPRTLGVAHAAYEVVVETSVTISVEVVVLETVWVKVLVLVVVAKKVDVMETPGGTFVLVVVEMVVAVAVRTGPLMVVVIAGLTRISLTQMWTWTDFTPALC